MKTTKQKKIIYRNIHFLLKNRKNYSLLHKLKLSARDFIKTLSRMEKHDNEFTKKHCWYPVGVEGLNHDIGSNDLITLNIEFKGVTDTEGNKPFLRTNPITSLIAPKFNQYSILKNNRPLPVFTFEPGEEGKPIESFLKKWMAFIKQQ